MALWYPVPQLYFGEQCFIPIPRFDLIMNSFSDYLLCRSFENRLKYRRIKYCGVSFDVKKRTTHLGLSRLTNSHWGRRQPCLCLSRFCFKLNKRLGWKLRWNVKVLNLMYNREKNFVFDSEWVKKFDRAQKSTSNDRILKTVIKVSKL